MCDSVWREALGLPRVSSAVAQLLVVRRTREFVRETITTSFWMFVVSVRFWLRGYWGEKE